LYDWTRLDTIPLRPLSRPIIDLDTPEPLTHECISCSAEPRPPVRGPLDGLAAALVISSGCGGQTASSGDTGKTNPKAAEQRRDMENFMKNQKKQ
jgi:hypothetical protein